MTATRGIETKRKSTAHGILLQWFLILSDYVFSWWKALWWVHKPYDSVAITQDAIRWLTAGFLHFVILKQECFDRISLAPPFQHIATLPNLQCCNSDLSHSFQWLTLPAVQPRPPMKAERQGRWRFATYAVF